MLRWGWALIATAVGCVPFAVNGAPLKVYVSGAMAHAIQQIAEDFGRKHGDTLDYIVGTTGTITDRIHKGEKPDLVEMTSAGLSALEKENLIVPGTHVELSRCHQVRVATAMPAAASTTVLVAVQ